MPLSGGRTTVGVVRVGDTVRRPAPANAAFLLDLFDLLAAQGEMTIKALAERLGVTEMTIHRDLDSLGKDGYLYYARGANIYRNDYAKAGR